jgi:GTP pyrophosphokinase
MRTLKFVKSSEKRLRIAHETMEIYAPLAERIGIQSFKSELQDLAFAELYSEIRHSILNRLEFLRQEDNVVVEKIVGHLEALLFASNINATVSGREKSPYSIWQKMERKSIGFEQLSDIMAFRILVPTISDCYMVLGIVHSNYHMVPNSFKDFISTPKENGYQSIHTVVMGPERQRVEIQIRTHDMHEVAELGVAAHWGYKQNYKYNTDGKQYRWIRELLEILERTADPEEFLEHTKMEMYYDQVFCFTPKGNIIPLPRGATPIDFAYAVHSDIGNTCVGAKVNGRIVPLRMQLSNGDQVEIVTSKTQVPSPSWEKFVVTGKARSEIKRFIRIQQKHESLNLGRAILSKSLREEGKELHDKALEPLVLKFKRKSVEDLLVAVGEGTISRSDIINALQPGTKFQTALKNSFSFFKFKRKKKPQIKEASIPIQGLIPGMAIHLAGCCHPIPGDTIVGIIHTGKGVTIHTSDCDMLENFSSTPERWVDVSWEKESNDMAHVGRIKVILSHEQGSLATVTSTIAKEEGNITNVKVVGRNNDFFEILVDIEVRGAKQLAIILSALASKSCIHSAERAKA